ncbi:MAG: hypothetical protein D3926_08005 [Desulfobacteraceae bacterium]|nr:MAG: hypothetical protein D3926_08005 [Desulfobacteraceae bacterium]
MKNAIKITGVVVLFLSVCAWTTPVMAQSQVGMIKNISGKVIVQRGETAIEAKVGDHLALTDTVITGEQGTAGIIFSDGTTFAVGPKTEFKLDGYAFEPGLNQYDFKVYLKQGSAIYNSGRIGKLAPEAVNLSTPRASVGIRGTRFLITVE